MSIRHADYVVEWLSAKGVRIVACHTGERSADRDEALERLARGELDAVAAVDLFNEGIDVPLIDRVVMLRPTGSPVVFLQQLGRGLRFVEGKRLQVIDFIGNHKVFLEKVRTLLSLAAKRRSIGEFLKGDEGEIELREGCRVNVDLEVIEMLRKFLPSGSDNETIRLYRELRDAREARPTPGELVRMGMNPRSLRAESWFAFVRDEGDLSPEEASALDHAPEWFEQLEKTPMTKSFKMVVLEVLLAEDALFEGIALPRLAALCHDALRRDPSLRVDVEGVAEFEEARDSKAWRAYWSKNPIDAWTKQKRWFSSDGEVLKFSVADPMGDVRQPFADLTRELADMRLATYRRRSRGPADGVSSFVCKVTSKKGAPFLELPDAGRGGLPEGETDIRTEDGRIWQFKFAKIACNVARPVGSQKNGLPDLLYRWFGPSAGKPGTAFQVRFRRSPEGWWAEPLGKVIEFPVRGEIVAFPTLRAAAGAQGDSQALVEADTVRLPFGGEDRFAVRAHGTSMDGGKRPIRNGDWVILEWARGLQLDAVAGKVCLLARGDADAGSTHHLKRVVRSDDGIQLRSDNPLELDLELSTDTVVLARMVEVVRPEELAPPQGTVVGSVREAFGLTREPTPGVSHVDGHLFILVDQTGILTAPNQLSLPVGRRNASETAFVLTASGDGWRYAGVGRWDGERWGFPDVDFETWRRLGHGRGASRALEPVWERAADNLVQFLTDKSSVGDWLEGRGQRCRLKGRSAKGGVRIDSDSMEERTVSRLDLAWVLQAHNRRKENGGRLDEAWVNYLRYLEGTPKESTRWIDTGWALVVLEQVVRAGFEASMVKRKTL